MISRGLAERPGDYDLIGGLVGFGVYALEHGEAGRPLAGHVLEHLERRARPRSGGLAWHTAPELLPPWQRAYRERQRVYGGVHAAGASVHGDADRGRSGSRRSPRRPGALS